MIDIIQFQYITRQIIIYFGFLILISGIIGNILNAIIFTKVRTIFGQNFCSFYFIGMAVTNLLYLLVGLLSRILSNGLAIDLSVSFSAFCKFRSFLVYTAPLISTSFTCLAAITQYLITSHKIHYRQKVTKRFVQWSILCTVLFWILHGISYAVLYDLRLSSTTNLVSCNSINFIFNQYTALMTYNLLIFIIPVLILIVFGYMTYRNITSLNAIAANQQHHTGPRKQQQLTIVRDILYSFQFFFSFFMIKDRIDANYLAYNLL
jgi:hypothetical protein